MRRFLTLTAFLALALPGVGIAARTATGDGTVVIKNGDGNVFLKVRGAAIGHFASGVMEVNDPDLTDGQGCSVVGAEVIRFINENKVRYSGSDVRFRCVGGRYTIRFARVRELSLGAVGRGMVTVDGAGGDDGTYSVDGSDPHSLPDTPTLLPFGNIGG
jgi:hypothetical protein